MRLKGVPVGLIIGLIVVVGFIYIAKTAVGENEPDKTQEEKIVQLIKQLGDDDWQKREEAEKALRRIGIPTEPFLKDILCQNPEPEVIMRVNRLLAKIEIKKQGKIAFLKPVHDEDFFGYICLMDADGKNQTHLTEKMNMVCFYLCWSPDGKKIAFISSTIGICIMDANGKNLKRLSNAKDAHSFLSWSPDGRKIAFVSKKDSKYQICVICIDGEDLIKLTDENATNNEPCWSPDGKKIVFTSNRDSEDHLQYDIYIMDGDGKNVVNLTNDKAYDSWPVWSPDGKKIAFQSGRDGNIDIYIMDADGKNITRLTNNTATDGGPCWSPDGKKIVFTSKNRGVENHKRYEIYIINVDGTNLKRLTKDGGLMAVWQPMPKANKEQKTPALPE